MIKNYLLPLLLFVSAVLSVSLPGCKPREEELQTSGALEFSTDTVKFDTVFTTLRTVTKRLWVYNRNPKAVNVDLISLDNPATSPYTLIINGDLKQTASGLYIRGKDSLLILVRAQLKDNGQNGTAKDYVLKENLNFRTNGQDQHVLLRSFGQNIYLHDNEALPCNAVWTNDRPHVLYNSVVVPAGCTLRIKPGTRIYAHAGAALIVEGTLLVNSPADFVAPSGSKNDTISATNANIVRFVGDRSAEAQYATAPGQWTGIVLDASSRGSVIRYAQIQNATFGVLLYNPKNQTPQPDVTIQNSVLRYISGANVGFAGAASGTGLPGAGVLGLSGKATLENTLFSDCYEYAVLGYGGGDYSLNYCTVANYPAASARDKASLTFTNVSALDSKVKNTTGLTLNVRNSIVWGSIEDEVFFENYDDYKATVSIRNSLLRSKLYAGPADMAATATTAAKPGLANPAYNNLFSDPKFVRLNTLSRNDYHLAATSPALASKTALPPLVPRDLLNLLRNPTAPDLGAYQTTK
ncbi:hypothetical protein GO988_18660 [Hymenobacter sp. HMF4947]|uniref:Right-handed parallel beta-helix repeat-containing protein n=1 Tax=Hymenobacter ginkgonis TaxID=2682976 RepID=A0A7K1TIX3_9BACT|nr:hypothetical protein [Hymenobacter ginkgonis]MVN78357.1 hypothetical protein [Hymenobacter ginkgonis]